MHGSLLEIQRWQTDESEIWVNSWPKVSAVLICPSGGEKRLPVIDYEVKLFALTKEACRGLLNSQNLFDGRHRIDFTAARETIWPVIEGEAQSCGYDVKTEETTAQLMYLPDAVDIPDMQDIPEGMTLGDLHPRYSSRLAPLWAYGPSPAETDLYMSGVISSFPSLAVHDQSTDELLAWMICYEDGAMGHLYVCPSVRRRGLARLLVTRLAAKIRERGQTPFIYIEPSNKVSYNLHSSLGFVLVEEKVSWISCLRQSRVDLS
ncbi:uncharacterized protein LOC135477787 [Liolophura sinensis]|uniref:uncharacterized protein LOC135477787 n=1 Tax=Liolophura sinensis TaxID=3198878 RepID=UPI00315932CE